MSQWRTTWRKIADVLHAHVFVALLVFLATLGAFIYYGETARVNVNKDANAAFMEQLRVFSTAAMTRLQLYDNFLRGGAGLFGVNQSLTQENWTNYYQPYDIGKQFPDVEGIGFSRYLTADQVPAYLDSLQAQGINLSIRPAGQRSVYVPVTYLARYTGNTGKSLGYDGYDDPTRHGGMQAAADSGQPAMSGSIQLISASQAGRPAFIIYLPVYQNGAATNTTAERRAAIYGFVYVSIDIQRLMSELLAENPNSNLGVRLADAQAKPTATSSYQSSNFATLMQQPGKHSISAPFKLYQHKWLVSFVAGPGIISAADRQRPMTILFTGFLASVVLGGVVWVVISSRELVLNREKRLEVQNAKDDLLSLASHQLRTPATVVKQYVGMLLQGYGGRISSKARTMLQHAYDSNERQIQIINQLLYVARLDAGRISLHKKTTDIVKLLREVCADHAVEVRHRRLKLKRILPRRPLPAEIDPHYFRMVLDNLMGNAVKYTPPGGMVAVEARKEGDEVVIVFTDTGIGIDGSRTALIFDKFTRIENDQAGGVSGSGIGLYLVKQIVSLHGGHIEVMSSLGHGSAFTVYLPLTADSRDNSGL